MKPNTPTPSRWNRLPLGLRIRLFRGLEALSAWRSGRTTAGQDFAAPAPRSLWVFVSTIGELNAIEPFIHRLLDELGHPELTLLSDRSHYGPAYLTKFPRARLATLSGTWTEVERLVASRPPLMLIVAEIPGLLHDAPCRFSFATVHAARRAGAPVVLVNGWLYGYAPPSRLDAIENALFGRDYARAFDLMLVQSEAMRAALLAGGAPAQRVVVTGNIKFDAMLPAYAAPAHSPLREALRRRPAGPVIVAGSVTESDDQRAVLDAFGAVLRQAPTALLVLAPRHPENRERMAALRALLDERSLRYRLRSESSVDDAVAGPVLVIDTMGELRGCYAEATLAFVGNDHNVLEPLAFGKPVFVFEGWEPTYPSYPVYRQLLDSGALHSVGDRDSLAGAWAAQLGTTSAVAGAESERIQGLLAQARGAVERCMGSVRAGLPRPLPK